MKSKLFQNFAIVLLIGLFSLTLYACGETPDKWTVHFDSCGGSAVQSIQVEDNNRIEEPDDPTKAGYIFIAWYKESFYENEFNFETERVTNDITLYAKWEEQTSFTIKFNSNGGSKVDDVVINKGEALSKPQNPSRLNYAFVEWCKDEDLTIPFKFGADWVDEPYEVITQDMTLYAKWVHIDQIYTFEKIEGANEYEIVDYTGDLTELTLPEYYSGMPVTRIGQNAFRDAGLENITFSSNLEQIDNMAFYGNDLVSIEIPASVTSISYNAFMYCYDLEKITVDPNNTIYDSREDCNAVIEIATGKLIFGCQNTTIPDSIKIIGKYAFEDVSLKEIVIPDGVVEVQAGAFSGCIYLNNVTLADSIKTFGESVFYGCVRLSSIILPQITTISDKMFESSGLEEITIPTTVTKIGEKAFSSTKITSINLNNQKIELGEGVFDSCRNLVSVEGFSGVTSLPRRVFYYCDKLTDITLSDQIRSIPENAFTYCRALTSLTLPTSLTTIYNYAFLNCMVESLSLPQSVEVIYPYALSGASNLKTITIQNELSSSAFRAITNCSTLETIYVPSEYLEYYTAELGQDSTINIEVIQ